MTTLPEEMERIYEWIRKRGSIGQNCDAERLVFERPLHKSDGELNDH